MARTRIVTLTLELDVVKVMTHPCDIDLGSRSNKSLGHIATIVRNIIQIQNGSKELCPGQEILAVCALDLVDIIFGQGHDTSFATDSYCVKYCADPT